MAYDPVLLGIHWDRLISIADEIVNALVRTSFSTNVRESYDLSCVVFDVAGRSIAQGAYSVPSFTGTAPATLRHMLVRYPADGLRPGDVIATNDPWMGTGHLYDINVMQPVFHHGALVGFVMSITHLPDIGGRGFGTTAREVYEEGLLLPIHKLVSQGEPDPFVLDLIARNVRVPEQTIGDIMANVSCTTVGARMIGELLDEFAMSSLKPLADAVIGFSETALRRELATIPQGHYANAIDIEGVDGPIRLACSVEIDDGEARLDFSGSGPAVQAGVNVPLCYTKAMAVYAIKCLTTPRIPNNEGSVRPIAVTAPPGSILNAVHPSPTGGRHIIGHFVGPLVFGALAEALPDRVQADAGMLNLVNVQGHTRAGRGVSSIFFASGGLGAIDGIDGQATTPSPSNMTGTSVEVWENLTDVTVLRKELVPGSGGAGRYRGGLGQRIEMRNDTGRELTMSCLAGRDVFPPRGYLGGQAGARRSVFVNGEPVSPKGRYVLAPGDRFATVEAGGGGIGDPALRDPARIEADRRDGYLETPDGGSDPRPVR